jgi:hypothetical protein
MREWIKTHESEFRTLTKKYGMKWGQDIFVQGERDEPHIEWGGPGSPAQIARRQGREVPRTQVAGPTIVPQAPPPVSTTPEGAADANRRALQTLTQGGQLNLPPVGAQRQPDAPPFVPPVGAPGRADAVPQAPRAQPDASNPHSAIPTPPPRPSVPPQPPAMSVLKSSIAGEEERKRAQKALDEYSARTGQYSPEQLRAMTPEQYSAVAPKLKEDASGRADPVGTDKQFKEALGTVGPGLPWKLYRLARTGARRDLLRTGVDAARDARDKAKAALGGDDGDDRDHDSEHMVTGRQWAMHRGQHQPTPNRAEIDKSIAGQHGGTIGKAEVRVKFDNVPKNVKTDANGEGAFKNIRQEKTSAMNTTGEHGGSGANEYHEE